MIKINVYRDLTKGDQVVVGTLELDEKLLPPDPFYSICLVSRKTGEFQYKPVAASLVDDYNLCIALSGQYRAGTDKMLAVMGKGDLA